MQRKTRLSNLFGTSIQIFQRNCRYSFVNVDIVFTHASSIWSLNIIIDLNISNRFLGQRFSYKYFGRIAKIIRNSSVTSPIQWEPFFRPLETMRKFKDILSNSIRGCFFLFTINILRSVHLRMKLRLPPDKLLFYFVYTYGKRLSPKISFIYIEIHHPC